MIASVSEWHEHHARAAEAIEARLDRGDEMFIAAHAMIETYAVLTRLPPGRRLSPRNARAIIEGSFLSHGTVVALSAAPYAGLLRRLEERSVAGEPMMRSLSRRLSTTAST
jgi:hypothetical protein